ncbi:hypothetical protein LguiA_002765 [Lonicera macranthoides]
MGVQEPDTNDLCIHLTHKPMNPSKHGLTCKQCVQAPDNRPLHWPDNIIPKPKSWVSSVSVRVGTTSSKSSPSSTKLESPESSSA